MAVVQTRTSIDTVHSRPSERVEMLRIRSGDHCPSQKCVCGVTWCHPQYLGLKYLNYHVQHCPTPPVSERNSRSTATCAQQLKKHISWSIIKHRNTSKKNYNLGTRAQIGRSDKAAPAETIPVIFKLRPVKATKDLVAPVTQATVATRSLKRSTKYNATRRTSLTFDD